MINLPNAHQQNDSQPAVPHAALTSYVIFIFLSALSPNVLAAFSQFSDEAAWRAAASPTVLEDFESFAAGSRFNHCPICTSPSMSSQVAVIHRPIFLAARPTARCI